MDFTSITEPISCEFTNFTSSSSNLFTSPAIPKIVFVGLNDQLDESLKVFKDILCKALDNLFVIEFCEQYIPHVNEKNFIGSTRLGYRSHQVKESWMYKVRNERPAILIDFRLLSNYETFNGDDSFLCEQIIQTRNSLLPDGPVYLVWLTGPVTSGRLASLIRATKMDKYTMTTVELFHDFHLTATNLKPKIQECFEHSRNYFKEVSKKYKKFLTMPVQAQKFMQPWMPTVYYYFKLAVMEEFRGDFQTALKYYHSILAKFKEIIESTNETIDERCRIINFLRPCSDICFIRLSFLLFRLDQSGEAEFGLFRYLAYFCNGLSVNDQFLWKYNVIRAFSHQLSASFVWSPGTEEKLMRGPAHFLICAISIAKRYLKSSIADDSYYLQEFIMFDLGFALESALKNSKLEYLVDYIQILILERYKSNYYSSVASDRIPEEAVAYLNYLKACPKLDGWPMKKSFLEDSIASSSQKDYKSAAIDIWSLSCLQEGFKLSDAALFEDMCLMHKQVFNESIRISFPLFANKFLFCSVKFGRPSCIIFDECSVDLLVYNAFESYDIYPESIGIFFDDESVEGISFICTKTDVFKAAQVTKFSGSFKPSKFGRGRLKISFITMQLVKPFLALQFDDSVFIHEQQSENSINFNFMRVFCKVQRQALQMKIEPLKPNLCIEFEMKDSKEIFTDVWYQVLVKVSNLTDHATIVDLFENSGSRVEIGESTAMHLNLCPRGVETLSLMYKFNGSMKKVKLKLSCVAKFDLQQIDFKFSEACSFEPIKSIHESNFLISPINPFSISLTKASSQGGAFKVVIKSFSRVHWLFLKTNEESFTNFSLSKGQVKILTFQSSGTELHGSFSIDSSSLSNIIDHTWTIK